MKPLAQRYLEDLCSALESDERVLAMQKAEEALSEQETLRPLVLAAQQAREDYLRVRLECGEDSEEAKTSLKRLHQAKEAMDEHPFAREYSLRLAELNALYRAIDDLLFGTYRAKRACRGCRHD